MALGLTCSGSSWTYKIFNTTACTDIPTFSASGSNANACGPIYSKGVNLGVYIKMDCNTNSAHVTSVSVATLMMVAIAFIAKKIQF